VLAGTSIGFDELAMQAICMDRVVKVEAYHESVGQACQRIHVLSSGSARRKRVMFGRNSEFGD